MTLTEVAPFQVDRMGRVPAFVGLAKQTGGVYLETPDMKVEDALRETGLDFTIEMDSMHDSTGAKSKAMRTVVGVFPDGRREIYGAVKKSYVPIQVPEALSVAQAILDDSDAQLAALGAYGDPFGSRVYAATKLGESILVGGVDPVDLYLTVLNSYDRSNSLTALFAPIRLGCTNETTATFRYAKNVVKIRHTKSAKLRIEEARAALKMSFRYFGAFQEEAEKLLAKPAGIDQLTQVVKLTWPLAQDASERKAGNWTDRLDEIVDLWKNVPNLANVRDTGWGVYNAFVEYLDHDMPVRGKELSAEETALAKANRIALGRLDKMKTDAWGLLAAA